jgi:predicted transcriptional regulator of viral defense system
MKQLNALQALQSSGKKIFTINDLQKILQITTSTYSYVFAKRLVDEGVLERVTKGYYLLVSSKPSDFELANALYRPSYISLDSALTYYGILVQSPQQVTSVSTKLTRNIESKGKMFSYSFLSPQYFTDYQRVNDFLIATPEKALVDTMYFTALGRHSLSWEELVLEQIDAKILHKIAARITNKAFVKYFKKAML